MMLVLFKDWIITVCSKRQYKCLSSYKYLNLAPYLPSKIGSSLTSVHCLPVIFLVYLAQALFLSFLDRRRMPDRQLTKTKSCLQIVGVLVYL